jgi:hypothetical protein
MNAPDICADWLPKPPGASPCGAVVAELDHPTLTANSRSNSGTNSALNIVVLYDESVVYINTVREHLESLAWYSRHHIHYANAVYGVPLNFDLNLFDVVVIHYSVRLPYPWHISPAFSAAVRAYQGLKLLFIQDEYDHPDIATAAINDLGIDVIFTCVPPKYQRTFYPGVRAAVEFCQVLTGYVSPDLELIRDVPPVAARRIAIGYRGRRLPYRYGMLGQEKVRIGQVMRDICRSRNIPHDIEWTEDKRFYGADWITFLASCRATLGTESGSNVIDRDGSLSAAIDKALADDPSLTFEQAFERFLRPYEGQVVMNQVSPRIFEAIALRTALVLFEGTYSNVVRPDVHFIPLQKDFGNVDEVLDKVRDDRYLEALTDRAYRDVILSGKYSYSAMVGQVDEVIRGRLRASSPRADVARLFPAAYLVGAADTWRLSGLLSKPIDSTKFVPPPPRPRGLGPWFPTPPPGLTFFPRLRWRAYHLLMNGAARCRLHWKNLVARLRLARLNQAARTRLLLRNQVGRCRTFLANQATRLHKSLRIARLYVCQRGARRAFHALVFRPSLRRSAGLSCLWQDLLRLDAIRRARPGGRRPVDHQYQVAVRFEPATGTLQLVTVGRPGAMPPLEEAAPPWGALESGFAEGRIKEIVWDHSAIGHSCDACMLVPSARFALGGDGRYRFDSLAALARLYPEQVIRLLQSAVGA